MGEREEEGRGEGRERGEEEKEGRGEGKEGRGE